MRLIIFDGGGGTWYWNHRIKNNQKGNSGRFTEVELLLEIVKKSKTLIQIVSIGVTLPPSLTLLTLLIIRAMIHGNAMKIEYDAKGHGNAMGVLRAFHLSSRVGKRLGTSQSIGCINICTILTTFSSAYKNCKIYPTRSDNSL